MFRVGPVNTVCVDVGTGAMLGGTYSTTPNPDDDGQSVIAGVKIVLVRISECMGCVMRNVVDIDRGYNLPSVMTWLLANGLDLVGTVQRKKNFPCSYGPLTYKPDASQIVIDKFGPRIGGLLKFAIAYTCYCDSIWY